jgi:hypothetical protein
MRECTLPQHGRKKGGPEDIIHEPISAKSTVLRFLSADRCDNTGSYKRALEQLRIVAGASEMIRLAGILADSDRESVWHEDVHVMYQNSLLKQEVI